MLVISKGPKIKFRKGYSICWFFTFRTKIITRQQQSLRQVEKEKIHQIQSIKMEKIVKQSRDGHRAYILSTSITLDDKFRLQNMETIVSLLLFLSSGLLISIHNFQSLQILLIIINKLGTKLDKFLPDELIIYIQQLQILDLHLLRPKFKKIVIDKSKSLNLQKQLQEMAYRSKLKKYNRLKITGAIFYSLILKYCYLSNKDRNSINLDYLFQPIIKQLYQNNYLYNKELYQNKVRIHLKHQRPFSLQEILNILYQTKNEILKLFPLGIDDPFENKYMNEFEEYVDQKERLIIEINKKKCQFFMKNKLQQMLQSVPKRNIVKLYQQNSKIISKQFLPLEHGTIGTINSYLSRIFQRIQKNEAKSQKKFQRQQKQKQVQLLTKIQNKKQQFLLIQKKREDEKIKLLEKQKQVKKLHQLQSTLNKKILQLKRTIKQNRLDKRDLLQEKLQFQDKLQKLLEKLRQMEQIQRQNVNYIQFIRKQMSFNPTVDRMQKKLSQIKNKCDILQGKQSKISSISTDRKLQEQNDLNITFFNKQKKK